jgi:hypothetical protein
MSLWIWLIGGLALAGAGFGLVAAMWRAERRARRTLFRSLGIDEATVQLLMARDGDVLAELTLVRRQTLPPAQGGDELTSSPPKRGRPAIRLVPPAERSALPSAPPPNDPVRPPADRRRLRLPGRS